MMRNRKIAAISVDLDGTLYPVQRVRVAWRLRFERGLLVALLAAREKIRHEGALLDAAALRIREAELVAPSFGMTVEETLARLANLRAAMPDALTKDVRPYPGVRDALLAAVASGLRIAVLSEYEATQKIRNLGLCDLPWAAIVAADECGALKPHPRAFHRVAECLNLGPEEILHIGDREELDVRGALRAGMRAWRFDPKGRSKSASERTFRAWGMTLFQHLA